MPRLKCVSACEALRATNYLQSIAPNGCEGGVFSTTARPASSIIPGLVSKVDPTPSISMTLVLIGRDAEVLRNGFHGSGPRYGRRAAPPPRGANETGSTSPRSCGLKLVLGE
jgi:hypothetical protein